jgi:hypothetical protein
MKCRCDVWPYCRCTLTVGCWLACITIFVMVTCAILGVAGCMLSSTHAEQEPTVQKQWTLDARYPHYHVDAGTVCVGTWGEWSSGQWIYYRIDHTKRQIALKRVVACRIS